MKLWRAYLVLIAVAGIALFAGFPLAWVVGFDPKWCVLAIGLSFAGLVTTSIATVWEP